MPELEKTDHEVLQRIAEDAINSYRSKTSGPLIAHPIEYSDSKGVRLDQSRYQYKPYPKMLYRADGATKIVGSAEEHAKAGKEWGEQPVKRPIWDTRKVEAGFSLSEVHLAFLQAHSFELSSMEEAKAWFQGLNDEAQEAFLSDAANWIPPEEKKRGPGRPKNPVDAA